MKKATGFIIGIVLLAVSLPWAGPMALEYIHDQRMDGKYRFTDISEGEPPTPALYKFNGQEITIDETPLEKPEYIDPWENEMSFSDIAVKVNGKEIDRLPAYPVRSEQEGLNRYFGDIAYFLVEDKKAGETSFVLALKRTKETISANAEGDHIGWVPEEELQYTYYRVSDAGDVTRTDFGYADRDGFETKLLANGHLAPTSVGYYTDLWHAYPSFFFPLLHPLLTMIAGGILIVFCWPFRKKRAVQ
ncbi:MULTISPECIES: hypothetical protein [Sporosarcina]|uniref:hypothetical protein n=1 Tax=Sporosarcina TaxID=1569 RepID=UPI00058AF641|nr:MULTISPECIES: hypothetical protein [Sporosarcina]WJY26825.1 hypothetical protein QWT68_12325 [Sporosarcina sp. 0.2-SM1T-5]